MNQILATSNVNSGKNKGPASIESVVKFFIVALIIFGVFLIGTGSYAIYKENADKNAKPRYTFGNGAIPTGNSRPSNYFKDKPTSKDILIKIFHTKKGKVVALNFGKNGYMVTMIAGKEPAIVKDGNCLPSSEK